MHNLTFWEAFAISVFGQVLRAIIKNPTKYAAIAGELNNIADEIKAAFPASN